MITFRLLDFGDMIMHDKIEGLTGRPTSGVLGFLFRIIGEGHIEYSKMMISEEGLQITRAQASKGFIDVTSTVTVKPDGQTEKGIPPDRPDLKALEEKLKQEIEITYQN